MSAKDRLADKLKSMKKNKLSNAKRVKSDGIDKPRSKPRDERSRTKVFGGGDNKGGGGTIVHKGKDGTTLGVGTGGSFTKSKGKDLVKAASAFVKAPIDKKTSLNISGGLNKGIKNKTVQDNVRVRQDRQKQIKVGMTRKFGGGNLEAQKDKLKKLKKS